MSTSTSPNSACMPTIGTASKFGPPP
jgi:hypothetical protein